MRYPEELAVVEELNNRPAAEAHLQQTESLFQWLEPQTRQS